MKKILLALTIVLSSLLLCNQNASATVVINNLTGGTQGFAASLSGPDTLDFFGGPFENREFAFSFTTGSVTVLLTEFVFQVYIDTISPIQIDLSTGTNAPGGTGTIGLGSVEPTSLSPAFQFLTLTPSLSPTLQANTQYWIHMTVPSGAGNYSVLNGNAPIVNPGWTLGNSYFTSPGDSWNELTSGPVARVRLTVEEVPEPCVGFLSGMGLLLILRRRRTSN